MSEKNIINEIKDISRRNFLVKAGTLATGVAVGSGLLDTLNTKNAEAAVELPFPWPTIGLELEKVKERGVAGYYGGGCCYGSAKALIDTLQEALPDGPWSSIPLDMFKFGAGGAISWGTLCGALNGSLAVINLVAYSTSSTNSKYSDLGNELIGWYTNQPFPNAELDKYTPSYQNQVTTIAKSPLCHTSVSLWCDASGKGVNSNEKKARCAKLTGETAAKAADLLNKWLLTGAFAKEYSSDATTAGCMTCHTGASSKYDDEQGKTSCGTCHDDTLHPQKI